MISAVIIGHNSRAYLPTCIESVLSQDEPITEILFVDNNSIDGSSSYIKENFPQVRIIDKHANLGYAKGANLGIDCSCGEYILIMNPDVILEADYIRRALKVLRTEPRFAAVTGKIYKYDFHRMEKTRTIDSTGLTALKGRRFLDTGAGLEDCGQLDRQTEVFGVSGNFPLFKREALIDARITGEYFDEDFFMYKEDVDLCWRLRLFGWGFVYAPKAVAYHRRGTGVVERTSLRGAIVGRRALSRFQRYCSYRNHGLMLLKNEMASTFLRDIFEIGIRERSSCFWILFFEWKTLGALLDVFRRLPKMLRKRRVIMQRRKVPSREILLWLRSSGIEPGLTQVLQN